MAIKNQKLMFSISPKNHTTHPRSKTSEQCTMPVVAYSLKHPGPGMTAPEKAPGAAVNPATWGVPIVTGYPKMGVLPIGWFIIESPINMDDL